MCGKRVIAFNLAVEPARWVILGGVLPVAARTAVGCAPRARLGDPDLAEDPPRWAAKAPIAPWSDPARRPRAAGGVSRSQAARGRRRVPTPPPCRIRSLKGPDALASAGRRFLVLGALPPGWLRASPRPWAQGWRRDPPAGRPPPGRLRYPPRHWSAPPSARYAAPSRARGCPQSRVRSPLATVRCARRRNARGGRTPRRASPFTSENGPDAQRRLPSALPCHPGAIMARIRRPVVGGGSPARGGRRCPDGCDADNWRGAAGVGAAHYPAR
jgi:hypothetical protein